MENIETEGNNKFIKSLENYINETDFYIEINCKWYFYSNKKYALKIFLS